MKTRGQHPRPSRRGGLLCARLAGLLSAWFCAGTARGADGQGEGAPPAPPFTDYRYEAPGNIRRITVDDLPPPFTTRSAFNAPRIVPRPDNAWPQAPAGFQVERYAAGLDGPRAMRTAPNGDVFVAQSRDGSIRVLRGSKADGTADKLETFAVGLDRPYGIAFYPPGPNPQWIYIGDTDAVVRIAYRNGDLRGRGPVETIVRLPHGGGHWTRDLQFSLDGKTLYVAVGSASNVSESGSAVIETDRADILAFDPDGSHRRVYAWGIRNPSGLAMDSATGNLWCIVNERDGLGDDLVPDYLTHVQAGGFYGWPWWYLGPHQDPRHPGERPELASSVIVPDVLLQAHSAPLQLVFYGADMYPKQYWQDIFATAHGSWNRAKRAGYEVIRVPTDRHGHATGEYQDFLTGFVLPGGDVWGRPVGITVAADGSLLVSDDASNSIWRVRYTGQ